MNILIISTQNPYKTSGIVALNLYKGFGDQGHNTRLLVKEYGIYNSNDIVSMETRLDAFLLSWKNRFKYWDSWFAMKLNKSSLLFKGSKTNPNYYVQDYDQTVEYYKTKKIIKKIGFKPDAIIYLFQQKFLNAKNLFELNKFTGAKIFWYLMDTAPLTGACHYSWDCERYKKGCGCCPALFSSNENDQSAINLSFKLKYLSKTNISIISPTEWQHIKAVESTLFKFKPIEKILLSIDSDQYNCVPKTIGKEKLNIPVNKKVIFFGATSINHTRKGMQQLIEALQILKESNNLKNENILLLVAGELKKNKDQFPFEYRELGLLANNEQLVAVYHAADVFVCPSIEDSGPMMINQSVMTGTPVVSFEMGVSQDLVLTGITGYRAKLKDSRDLAKGIEYVLSLNDEAYNKMCGNCRDLAISNYSFNISSKKIIQFIQK